MLMVWLTCVNAMIYVLSDKWANPILCAIYPNILIIMFISVLWVPKHTPQTINQLSNRNQAFNCCSPPCKSNVSQYSINRLFFSTIKLLFVGKRTTGLKTSTLSWELVSLKPIKHNKTGARAGLVKWEYIDTSTVCMYLVPEVINSSQLIEAFIEFQSAKTVPYQSANIALLSSYHQSLCSRFPNLPSNQRANPSEERNPVMESSIFIFLQ